MPCLRVVFVNSASRWVFCPSKNPAGYGANQAPILDTNIPPEMVPDWASKAYGEREAETGTPNGEDTLQPVAERKDQPHRQATEILTQALNQPVQVLTKTPPRLPTTAAQQQLDMILNDKIPTLHRR